MRKHTVETAARAFTMAAELYPASYIRILLRFFEYDLMLVRLVKTPGSGEANDSRIDNRGADVRSGLRPGSREERPEASGSESGSAGTLDEGRDICCI